ncbi:hypothetical protein GCM10022221_68050 [Actinocorallia aurea]
MYASVDRVVPVIADVLSHTVRLSELPVSADRMGPVLLEANAQLEEEEIFHPVTAVALVSVPSIDVRSAKVRAIVEVPIVGLSLCSLPAAPEDLVPEFAPDTYEGAATYLVRAALRIALTAVRDVTLRNLADDACTEAEEWQESARKAINEQAIHLDPFTGMAACQACGHTLADRVAPYKTIADLRSLLAMHTCR